MLDATLTENFGVSIDGNFEVDFTGFEAIIDMVGGIDIELTSAEADYINKRNDTSIVAGLNHLNGAETLTYARARKIDSDFGRTERQRKVLMAVYEQTKNLPASEFFDLMNNALPYLTTDLTDSEILSLAYRLLPLASSISISSHTVPASDCYYSANIRGMSVLVPDLPLIRQRLERCRGISQGHCQCVLLHGIILAAFLYFFRLLSKIHFFMVLFSHFGEGQGRQGLQ